ncbi:MAG TPA: hypothetical protein VL049_22200 [Candidatus Dormibacteraeota bacterium]|nr:hypothetical protein [Candidatus Dormibacteraeota bacterium]
MADRAHADIIPPSAWHFGDPDPAGTRYFRRALVRVPDGTPPGPVAQ